jgi:hypothetical protein
MMFYNSARVFREVLQVLQMVKFARKVYNPNFKSYDKTNFIFGRGRFD